MTDFGCLMTGITIVPLYDTLGKEAIEYILDQTQMKTVVCSADKIRTLLTLKAQDKVKNLDTIIYCD